MNAQIVFNYKVNDKSEQITKPFSFNILPDDRVIGTNSSNFLQYQVPWLTNREGLLYYDDKIINPSFIFAKKNPI